MLTDTFKKTIKHYRLLSKGDAVLVAVSGGPDSVALLYLLNSLRKELGLRLHVAHLDHRLRKDSSRDRRFVEELCRRLKLPLTAGEADVAKLAQKKSSLEEVAREARLKFLFAAAEKYKIRKIALGHNLDDQAETVLMRVLRGTGLQGLSGIQPKRAFGKFILVRPLLEIRRSQIRSFLRRKKITPCYDRSNAQDLYLRNRVRNRLLPLLEREYNKNIKEVLSNLAESAAADYDYLIKKAQDSFSRSKGKISLKAILKQHPALRRISLRLAIGSLQGNTRRISFRHIKEIEDLLFSRPAGSIVHLPQGISVTKKAKFLAFSLE